MPNIKESIQDIQEGYSKALTFWQNFISPPEPPSVNIDTSNVQYAPGRNLALEQHRQSIREINDITSNFAKPASLSGFSTNYAAQAARAARHDVNVNPAVVLPQFYGGPVFGLPQMPYLMPPQEQIYRPIDFASRAAVSEDVESAISYTPLTTSPLEQIYEYHRGRQGAFASAFGSLVPKTLIDIVGFGLGGKIATSIVGRSVLGKIPYIGGISRAALSIGFGMPIAALLSYPLTAFIESVNLHNERAQAAEMLTKEFVTVGPELAPLGRGLAAGPAARLGYGMMRIAERMGTVAYRDVEEILKIGGSGGLFMLDQTSLDIEKKLRNVIKVFGEVAKITNDPSMEKHIRNIAEFYKFGGGPSQYLAAIEMGGMTSRVTGMPIDHLMSTYGAMGMSTFQAMGLVPAYGAMYGLQARLSTQLAVNAGAFSPERLATLGGIEGVTASLIRGQAVSASAFSNLVLPAMITAGPGGTIDVNTALATSIARSTNPLDIIARQPSAIANYARNSGRTMAQALQDFYFNSNILQSEIMKNDSLIGQVFLMNAANQLTRMSGGAILTESALTMLGVDRDTAIAMTKTYGDPKALREMRKQAMIQAAEISERSYEERRAAISSLGIGYQVGLKVPIERAIIGLGREFVHEGIVTPFRRSVQQEALRGTMMYAEAQRRESFHEEFLAAEERARSPLLANVSKWFGERWISEEEEARIEAIRGRSILNKPLARMSQLRPYKVFADISEFVTFGLADKIFGEYGKYGLAASIPVLSFLKPVLGGTMLLVASAKQHIPTEEETMWATRAAINNLELFNKAMQDKSIEPLTADAFSFLSWATNKKAPDIRSYLREKYGDMSEEELEKRSIAVAAGIRMLETSVSQKESALAKDFISRMHGMHKYIESLSGSTIKALREAYAEGTISEIRRQFGKDIPPEKAFIQTGHMQQRVIVSPKRRDFLPVSMPLLKLDLPAETLDKLTAMIDEFRKAKSPEEKANIRSRISRLVREYMSISAGAEEIDLEETLNVMLEKDFEDFSKGLAIKKSMETRFKVYSRKASTLVEMGYMSKEEFEEAMSKGTEKLEQFLSERTMEAFQKRYGRAGVKEIGGKVGEVVEKIIASIEGKESGFIEYGDYKIDVADIRSMLAKEGGRKQLEEKITIMTAESNLRAQIQSKTALGTPSTTAPGGSAEAQTKLVESIDKLIEAAEAMKGAVKNITEARNNKK